jgi:hypothetical protein
MKLFFAFLFSLMTINSKAQTYFETDIDVLLYLNTNGPFYNKNTDVTLNFSDMGGSLSTGRSKYFNPDLTIVSSYRAVAEYQSLNNPNGVVRFIVDSRENVIMDRSDKTIYVRYSDYLEENRNNRQNYQYRNDRNSSKSKVTYDDAGNVISYDDGGNIISTNKVLYFPSSSKPSTTTNKKTTPSKNVKTQKPATSQPNKPVTKTSPTKKPSSQNLSSPQTTNIKKTTNQSTTTKK